MVSGFAKLHRYKKAGIPTVTKPLSVKVPYARNFIADKNITFLYKKKLKEHCTG